MTRTHRLSAAVGIFLSLPAMAGNIKPISPEVHTFNSPMILEYSLAEAFSNPAGPTTTEEFRDYFCRGVNMERVTIQQLFDKERRLILRMICEPFNSSGKDKRVTITMALLRDGEVISTGPTKVMLVPADETAKSGRGLPPSPQEVIVPMPAGSDKRPFPSLRLTITAKDY